MHELVELARTQCEGGEHFPRAKVLAPVGNDTGFNERHDAVAEHFGVDAEIVFLRELHHHRIGDTAKTDLQRGAVGHQLAHMLADGGLYRLDLRQADFENRFVAFDEGRHLREVYVAVAVRIGHIGVHFQHHGPCLGDGGHRVVGAEAERKVTVLIHFRSHGEHHVGAVESALDQHRQFGEIRRDEVDPTFLAAGPRSAAKKIRGMPDVLDGFGIEVGKFAQRQRLRHLNAEEVATLL